MLNKKITKRTIFVTEFTKKETRALMRLVKMTGTTKAVVLRSLAREGLAAYTGQLAEMDLFRIAKLGKL